MARKPNRRPTRQRNNKAVETNRELAAQGALTVPDAAAFLGIKRSTLYLLIDSGELRAAKIMGRRVVPRVVLQRYLAARMDEENPS